MGRKRTGSVYPTGQGVLRYKYILPDGAVWDRKVPPDPSGGPLDAEWGELYLASFRRQVESGWDPRTAKQEQEPSPSQTVGEYVMGWAKSQTYDNAAADARSLERHFLLSPLAALKLSEAKPRHCLAFISWLKGRPSHFGGVLANRTVRLIAGCVQRALDQAVRDELIATTPWNLPPRALPGITDKTLGARQGWVFTLSEVQALCYDPRITQEHRAIFAVLFLGGCRTGELVALRLRDWDRSLSPLGSITVDKSRSRVTSGIKDTKTHAARRVPVHPALAAILGEWVLSGLPTLLKRPAAPDDLLFPSPKTGIERTQNGMYFVVRADLPKLGLRHRRAHDTRRTHISLLVDAGARREVFSVWTHGHKGDVVSNYTSAAWKTYCDEMMKMDIHRPQEQRAVVNSAINNAIHETSDDDKVLKVDEESSSLQTSSPPRSSGAVLSGVGSVSQVAPKLYSTGSSKDTHLDPDSAIRIAKFPANHLTQFQLDEEAALDSIEALSEEDTHD
jgi:integrase